MSAAYMIPPFPVGTTYFGEDGTPDENVGGALLGQRVHVRDQVEGTMNYSELICVRVTASGGLKANHPWKISDDLTEATDYADGAGDRAMLPDPDLTAEATIAENDICYVVAYGTARCAIMDGGDATGFAPGTLVTIDTTGDAAASGLKSESTLSKATIGEALETVAATTADTLNVRVYRKY